MKICYVHDGYFSEKNGVFYCNVINHIRINNFLRHFDNVLVIARRGDYKEYHVKIDFNNIDVVLVKSITSPISYLQNISHVKATIRDAVYSSDIIHCGVGPMGIIASSQAKKLLKKNIMWIGGCINDSMKNFYLKHRLLRHLSTKIAKQYILNSDNVLYVANYLIERYPTKGNYEVWSDVRITEKNISIEEKRMGRVLIESEDIVLGLIGYTNNKIKGIDTAIRALALLSERYKLKILGDGNHLWLDKLVAKYGLHNRVEFCGTLEGGVPVWNWLDNIDIYIQPSITEGLPKATIEAMSRGCPVVSTNAGGLTDIVDEQWIHSVGDFTKLAELILKLSSNRDLMKESSFHSFSIANNYRPAVLLSKFDMFFESLIDNVNK